MKLLGVNDAVTVIDGVFIEQSGKVVTFNKNQTILVNLGKSGSHNFKFEQLKKI